MQHEVVRVVSDDEIALFQKELPAIHYPMALQMLIDSRLENISLAQLQRRIIQNRTAEIKRLTSYKINGKSKDTKALHETITHYYEELIAIDLCRKLGYSDPSEDRRDPILIDLSQFETKPPLEFMIRAVEYIAQLWQQDSDEQ